MLNIYPMPMNINPLNKIPSNANTSVACFYHDIVEYNTEISNI